MLDLDAIKAREVAATAGPWIGNDVYLYIAGGLTQVVCQLHDDEEYYDDASVNMAFIAAARTDIPALIAEVERLRRIEAAARAHLAEWESGDTFAHDTRKALKQALEGE